MGCKSGVETVGRGEMDLVMRDCHDEGSDSQKVENEQKSMGLPQLSAMIQLVRIPPVLDVPRSSQHLE